MSDDRPLHEVLFEYAVYVPIGIAASLAEQLPELTARGRRLAGARIHVARLMGEFAVGHAQRQVGRIFSSDSHSSVGTGQPAGSAAGPPSRHGPDSVADGGVTTEGFSPVDLTEPVVPTAGEPKATPATRSGVPRRPRRTPSRPASEVAVVDATVAASTTVPVVESLPIPAYNTLAASQVVQRLSSLEPDELEAVRRYEIGTRGRRTILHRIAQLNAGAGHTPL